MQMKIGRFTTRLACSLVGVLALAGFGPSAARAQDHDGHLGMSQAEASTPDQQKQMNALVKIVRDATDRFHDDSGVPPDPGPDAPVTSILKGGVPRN